MKTFSLLYKSSSTCEGKIDICRDIYDNTVLFERDGRIVAARSSEPLLSSGANLFDFMSKSEATNISKLCVSFKYNRLVLNTKLGAVIIYTDTCGACGLMTAVFPFASATSVSAYFTELNHPSVFISDEIKALTNTGTCPHLKEFFTSCDEVFMTANIALAKYSFGDGISETLVKHLLDSANFLGCVGTVYGAIDRRPSFDNYSPELFSAMTHCCMLFARNHGSSRSFTAKIFEYNFHPIVSFCVNTEKDFHLMRGGEYAFPELAFCLSIAERRNTFFECYHRHDKSAVIIAFSSEIDPIDGRIIKQDVAEKIKNFFDVE